MIITFSGQYGSGGNEIGTAIAEKLGYRLLDSQLVIRAREIFTEETGGGKPAWWPSRYGQPFFEEDDIPIPGTAYEQAQFRLETDLIGSTEQFETLGTAADSVREAMLSAQTKAIEEYTEGGNCVIFGKCANFVLRNHPDALHIFVSGDLEQRIKRICNLYNVTMDKVVGARWMPPAYALRDAGRFINMSRHEALSLIETTDHRRASCYEFITGEKWGAKEDYDLFINTDSKHLDKYVEEVMAEIEKRQAK